MKRGATVLEKCLSRTGFRWAFLHSWEAAVLICSGTVVAVLVLCTLIVGGILRAEPAAEMLLASILVAGLLLLISQLIRIRRRSPRPEVLAEAIEGSEPRLGDRLFTLVFLRNIRPTRANLAFESRIASETEQVLAAKTGITPFTSAPAWRQAFGLLTMMLILGIFLHEYRPWRLLQKRSVAEERGRPGNPYQFASPPANRVEQKSIWGEVRITEPGRDLKVTKVDVVPLQVEAATSDSLREVVWLSSINGQGETKHVLPRPSEPKYAVFQPVVYLDEWELSDWDVITYYARADANATNTFASQVYFLEIRPFREDILKLPGGASGKAYQSLNQISTLIHRQQDVIRQTHQHQQSPPTELKVRQQDRGKLAAAESELGASAQHLYAQMGAEMETKPIGEALDNLAKAERSLHAAADMLGKDNFPQAQERERSALAELVAARKTFQKAVTDDPGAFAENHTDESIPTAHNQAALDRMAEFRDEAKAAKEFVQQQIEAQREIEKQIGRAENSALAARENHLRESLEEFAAQHPQTFRPLSVEVEKAVRALNQSSRELLRANTSPTATAKAGEALEALSEGLQRQTANTQLTDMYRLGQVLAAKARQFDQAATNSAELTDEGVRDAVGETRQALAQLEKAPSPAKGTGSSEKSEQEAFSPEKQAKLEEDLNRFAAAEKGADRQAAAKDVARGLQQILNDLENRKPSSLQAALKEDQLNSGGAESFAQGRAELESLARRLGDNKPAPEDQRQKQARQALEHLREGAAGHAESAARKELAATVNEALNSGKDLDLGLINKLLEQIGKFSAETATREMREQNRPALAHVDPERLPPAYRARIQHYFQKLSEK